jgi:hypothetical protein
MATVEALTIHFALRRYRNQRMVLLHGRGKTQPIGSTRQSNRDVRIRFVGPQRHRATEALDAVGLPGRPVSGAPRRVRCVKRVLLY